MPASLNRYRVLIIDDNSAIHEDFRKVLQPAPAAPSSEAVTDLESMLFGDAAAEEAPEFDVDFANSGEQGLEKVKQSLAENRPYAMAFVDMRMPPGWDGVQTVREIWKVNAGLQVAICTAYSDYAPDQIASGLGLRGRMVIVRKPFDGAEVRQLASMVCEKWEISRQRAELAKAMESRTADLKRVAQVDSLTGLPNRSVFADRLGRALVRAKRDPSYRFAVLFADCDNFKIVNDTLGHPAGDALLLQLSKRLQLAVRELDTVSRVAGDGNDDAMAARIGGDEFAIILDGISNDTDAARVAQRLLAATTEPFQLEGRAFSSSMSVGITTNSIAYTNGEDMIRDADIAMYHAKRSGRSQFAVFDAKMHEAAIARLTFEADLRAAIDSGAVRPFYQPIVSTKTRGIVGFESLARWIHPTRGVISPAEFIPLAEETGMIVPLGLRMLEASCTQLATWQKQFPHMHPLTMSVNVSRKQLVSRSLVDDVAGIIRKAGVDPRLVKLEITESTAMEGGTNATDVLSRLKRLDVQLHMDDFGTGHSSLSCLQSFPLDGLKIDRSFVKDLKTAMSNPVVLQAITTLARGLQIPMVAEGVETDAQFAALEKLGCQFAQGYLFAKPLDAVSATAFLAKWAEGAIGKAA